MNNSFKDEDIFAQTSPVKRKYYLIAQYNLWVLELADSPLNRKEILYNEINNV